MNSVVRAALVAATLLASLGATTAHAELVKYRIKGIVIQSWPFADGTVVPAGAPVTVTYTYDHLQSADALDKNESGSGSALYAVGAPYHFRIWAGEHRVRAEGFHVALSNDLVDSPFGDVYEVRSEGGAWIDGTWHPEASMGVSLMSQYGHFDALRALRLPRYLRESRFDAFRVGTIWRTPDQPQLQFDIVSVRSTVCAAAQPGTDDCADTP
jgi:hypothetical protein